ncbi:conserved hypothetical protein [Brochothrix thermosphacta]|nr:conserved hypothetical protein [Brochothrix thermosphacta]
MVQIVDKVSKTSVFFEADLSDFDYDMRRVNRNGVIVETTSE